MSAISLAMSNVRVFNCILLHDRMILVLLWAGSLANVPRKDPDSPALAALKLP
jgi:hypothetical protein